MPQLLRMIAAGWLLTHAAHSVAQSPPPKLNDIFPCAASPGSESLVHVGGRNLDSARSLSFSHSGIVAVQKMLPPGEFRRFPEPDPGWFHVQVSHDVPIGVYEARVIGRFGQSSLRHFEVVPWPVRTVDHDKIIPLNTSVIGQAQDSAYAEFRFQGDADRMVLVDVRCRSLDSNMTPLVAIFDAEGNELMRQRGAAGELVLPFLPPTSATYTLQVADSLFRGGGDRAYLLSIHDTPRIIAAIPSVIPRSGPARVTLLGYFLSGQRISLGSGDWAETRDFDLAAHPPLRSPQHTQTHDLSELLGGRACGPAIMLPTTHLPVAVESSDNDRIETAQHLTWPCELAGSFFPQRDIDWLEVHVEPGQRVNVEVISSNVSMPADPVLIVRESIAGKPGSTKHVATIDDIEEPQQGGWQLGSVHNQISDPTYVLKAASKATYLLGVHDAFRNSRGDRRLLYRLRVTSASKAFELIALPPVAVKDKNATPGTFSVRRGDTTTINVRVARKNGHARPLRLTVQGLPPGVHAAPTYVRPEQNLGTVLITANASTGSWDGFVSITGQEIDGQGRPAGAPVRAQTFEWIHGTSNYQKRAAHVVPTQHIAMSVLGLDSTPATLSTKLPNFPIRTALGGVLKIPVELSRQAYDAALTFTASGLPAKQIEVQGNKLEGGSGEIRIHLKDQKLPVGYHSFHLASSAKIKTPRNPQAIRRAELAHSFTQQVRKTRAAQVETLTRKRKAAESSLKKLQAKHDELQSRLGTAREKRRTALASLQQAMDRHQKQGQTDATLVDRLQTLESSTAKARMAAVEVSNLQNELKPVAEQRTKAELESKTLNTQLTETTQGLERSEKAVADAKKRLDAVRKANPANDVTYPIRSPMITLLVEPSPVAVKSTVVPDSIIAGAESTIQVKIERFAGYEGPVELSFEAPHADGLQVSSVTIPEESETATVTVKADPTMPAVAISGTLVARVTFGGLKLETKTPVKLNVKERLAALP